MEARIPKLRARTAAAGLGLAAALLAASCGGGGAAGGSPDREAAVARVEPFQGAHATVQDLIAAVLDAASSGDVQALRRLRVDESEHGDVLWPELDASRPERNVPADFAWSQLEQKSRRGERTLMEGLRGGAWRVESVTFTEPLDAHRTFSLHGGTRVVARDARGGVAHIDLIGAVVERAGRYKLLNYREP